MKFHDLCVIVSSDPLTQQKHPMEPTAVTVTSAYRCFILFSRLAAVSNGGEEALRHVQLLNKPVGSALLALNVKAAAENSAGL